MKRRSLLLTLLVLCAFLTAGTIVVLPSSDSPEVQATRVESHRDVNSGPTHKLILRNDDQPSTQSAYETMSVQGGVIKEVDYGSFKLVIADERKLGGRAQLLALGEALRDDMDVISINGYRLDTTNPESAADAVPSGLRQGDGIAASSAIKRGLYIVQFVGPIKDEWLKSLDAAGARIAAYLGSNAYVVWAGAKEAAALTELRARDSNVQFIGDYHPAYKLSPRLQTMSGSNSADSVEIVARVVGSPDAQPAIEHLATLGELMSSRDERGSFDESLSSSSVRLRVAATRLADIARIETVLTVDEAATLNADVEDRAGRGAVHKQFEKFGQPRPSPAMVRAFLANVGDARSREAADSSFIFRDKTRLFTQTGETFEVSASAKSNAEPVRVTLAWIDARGGLANRVNDLDLEVAIDGATHITSGALPASEATSDPTGIKSVIIPSGFSGDFKVVVRASNLAGDGNPSNEDRTDQHFALVVSNAVVAAVTNPSISVSPFSLNIGVPFGTAVVSQSITINSNDSWQTSGFLPSWMQAFPSSGSAGFSFVTLRIFPGSFCPGFTFGSATFRTSSCCAQASVSVNLTVNGALVCTSPSSLTFNSPDGSTPPAQTLNISNCGNGTMNWSATDDASWLNISPTSGTAGSVMTVSVNTAGLPNGTHTGRITFTTPNGCGRQVQVTLNISRPTIVTNPASLSFSAVRTGPNPPNQSIAISTPVSVLNWSASDDATWLAVSPASGTAPSTLTVSVNKTGLAAGTYTANITITSPNAGNSPKVVPVTLNVTNAATLTVNPTTMTFFKNLARPLNPAPKTFTISISGGSATWTATSNVSWLTVSPGSGSVTAGFPASATASVSAAGLEEGSYSGTITVSAPGLAPQTIQVTFTVTEIIIEPPPPNGP
jgi:hypothetical protein